MNLRLERIEEHDGIRLRIVEERRVRYPPKPILRSRTPVSPADPDALLTRLDHDHASMAERVLREGARGWRRWSTLKRKAGPDFSPIRAETELLDALVREAGLLVEDRFHDGQWLAARFKVDESIWPWLGILDPEAVRQELREELTQLHLLAALADGPPRGMEWESFAFVLRAAERLADLRGHGVRPGARELAGQIDHTKAWTDRRRGLLEKLLGAPFEDLVARYDRPIEIKGPIAHAEGDLWASSIDRITFRIEGSLNDVVLVENRETFRHLLPLADRGFLVLWIPGGPPPAEVALIKRLAHLSPQTRFHACFDLDPAGIRIAHLIEQGADVSLQPTGMNPELFEHAPRRLPLSAWDRQQLSRLKSHTSSYGPLIEKILQAEGKVEQETVQQHLFMMFEHGIQQERGGGEG